MFYWLQHASLEHFVMNLVAVVFMMVAVGWRRGLVSFAFGVFGGWLAFMMFSSGTLIGASGGVFGMLTTLWYMHPAHKILIFGIIIGEVYLSTIDPNISTVAHAGGALAGTVPLYFWRKHDTASA